MKSGKVGTVYFQVMTSKHDHPLDYWGWMNPFCKRFDNSEKALEFFNELIIKPDILKAEIRWKLVYDEKRESHATTSYTNCFTIAHYDHKAKTFENYASSNNFWESNKDKRQGIMNRYHN
jgi:hypothetical protein